MNLAQAIKERAYQLGFSLAGITTPEPLPHGDVFDNWLLAGRHGEMAYLNTPRSRQCRAHPQEILPECQSVVALGVRYPAPLGFDEHVEDQPLGRIAAYAWGEDYHDLLPARLQKLAEFVESQVGHAIPNRGYTDTGPILEREVAQRAGLGWIGKNTCLINPRQGSYFLLAELLLGIELEPDPPFQEDRCGTCRRCIEACPTGCILPDRTLDARRCISYLTIELKGFIPPELRAQMDSWVFGCDVCQQVCPWNRFASPEGGQVFERRIVTSDPSLLEEMGLQSDAFNRKYRRSPLKRAKRRGYLRNVALALGNRKDKRAIPILTHVLWLDPEPLVRAHAAWALAQVEDEAARHALEASVQTEEDALVLAEIKGSLRNV